MVFYRMWVDGSDLFVVSLMLIPHIKKDLSPAFQVSPEWVEINEVS